MRYSAGLMAAWQDPERDPGPESVGLPVRPFLYSIDQLAGLLSVEESAIRKTYLHYDGRMPGVPDKHRLRAVNIAPPDSKPDWRVAERELVRWMRFKGFRYYETAVFTH